MQRAEESEAEFIVRRMTELGFSPSPGFDSAKVTFFKDYADDDARRARAWVFFDKPIMSLADLRLANFSITVQASIAATREDVEREAPSVLRADLLDVLSEFQDLTRIPDQSIIEKKCVRCSEFTAEYYMVNEDIICLRCVEARKHAQR